VNPKIELLSKAKVLVVGDVMLDRYWQGDTSRISPEAPVPVVHIRDTFAAPGGAGNVALNLSKLGAQATLLAAVGRDENAEVLRRSLTDNQVMTQLFELDRPTTTKLRLMSQHQQLIRIDFEDSSNPFSTQALPGFWEIFTAQLAKADVLILSDYAKGFLSDPQPLIQAAHQQAVPVLVDPKTNDFSRYRQASIITPNLSEFEAVVGECREDSELIERGQNLIAALDLSALLITRGAKGMILLQREAAPSHYPAIVHEVYDVTGAGDTVISLLASAIAADVPLQQAVEIANIGAGLVVTKLGAVGVSREELQREYANQHESKYGVVSGTELEVELQASRAKQEKIVMTNGCFDILHTGHIDYLKAAKALGDRLLIAVNSDASVKRLKGAKRPINTLATRMELLAALAFVDWVVAFDEDTPRELIARFLPDYLVKGGDYQVAEVVGGDIVTANGGRVEILEYKNGFSTTNLINSIVAIEESI
jgi:D-beta-D-heptose 7-phosphate kinase / D-beta-D-heptose 1-phosphate adenosyltransferase